MILSPRLIEDGETPNIALMVREKCAESENPAAWAASVAEIPSLMPKSDRRNRRQSTYCLIGKPVSRRNNSARRLFDNPQLRAIEARRIEDSSSDSIKAKALRILSSIAGLMAATSFGHRLRNSWQSAIAARDSVSTASWRSPVVAGISAGSI